MSLRVFPGKSLLYIEDRIAVDVILCSIKVMLRAYTAISSSLHFIWGMTITSPRVSLAALICTVTAKNSIPFNAEVWIVQCVNIPLLLPLPPPC